MLGEGKKPGPLPRAQVAAGRVVLRKRQVSVHIVGQALDDMASEE